VVPKRITIVDIARAVGVTDGTVSRALADDPRVHPDTKKRILDTAARLNYRPNLAARAVKRGSTRNVGVFCGGGSWMLYNEYFGRLLAGVAEAAQEQRSHLMFYLPQVEPGADPNPESRKVTLNGIDDLRNGHVDSALIVSGHAPTTAEQTALRKLGLPVVLLGTNREVKGFSQLGSGARERTELAAARLYEGGYRRIGFIGLSKGGVFDRESMEGLKAAAVRAHRKMPPELLQTIAHWDIDSPEVLRPPLERLIAARADALLIAAASQALTVEVILDSMSIRDLPLVSFGPMPYGVRARDTRVRLVNAELIDEGRRAFALLQQTLARPEPHYEVMRWVWPG
jgi:DNA-binding LacI/PurR family transcriptional regulator